MLTGISLILLGSLIFALGLSAVLQTIVEVIAKKIDDDQTGTFFLYIIMTMLGFFVIVLGLWIVIPLLMI